eukprot:scaffold137378_cov27-Tisochrysis_lutea.AAC.1
MRKGLCETKARASTVAPTPAHGGRARARAASRVDLPLPTGPHKRRSSPIRGGGTGKWSAEPGERQPRMTDCGRLQVSRRAPDTFVSVGPPVAGAED